MPDRREITAGDVGNVYFGPNHPMKPHRLCMTHHLVLAYELHNKMEIYVRISTLLEFRFVIVYLEFVIQVCVLLFMNFLYFLHN